MSTRMGDAMRTRAGLAVTGVVAVLVAVSGLSGLSGGGALAASAASVQVSPAVAWPGLPVTVTGSGFPAGTAAQVRLDGVATGTVTVGRGGRVSARLGLPRTARSGAHRVSVVSGSVSAATSLRARLQWTQVGLYPAHRSNNWNEHKLSRTTVGATKQLFNSYGDYGPDANGFVVAEGLVIWGARGFVRAIDATTGAERWTWLYDNSDGAAVNSIVYDPTTGLVYVARDQSAIIALDALTGAQVWQAPLPGPANYWGLTLLNGVLYLIDVPYFTHQMNLTAFNVARRQIVWQSRVESRVVGADEVTPMIYDGAIYVANLAVECFDLETGKLRWTTPLSKDRNVVAYRATVDQSGVLLTTLGVSRASMFDLKTGKVLWTTAPAPNDGWAGSITTGGGRAYVEGDGATTAFDEASGAVVWTRPSHPAVGLSYANGLLYGGLGPANGFGTSMADGATGEILQTLPAGDSSAQAVILDGRIYLPNYPMTAYALPGSD